MDLSGFYVKLKDFVARMNAKGLPLPTVRDPMTGVGSVSLTLLVISSVMVILGIFTKWSGKLGGIDVSNALDFFYASSALYFGRKFQTKKGNTIEGSGSVPESSNSQAPVSRKADDPDAP